MIDYHMHTPLCGHAVGSPDEYIRRALELGLEEIGFSEHLYLYHLPPEERDPTLAMREDEMSLYIGMVEEVRERHPEIAVRLGLEADYIPGHEQHLARILEAFPGDYVYGSVHFIDGWGFDDLRYVEGYSRWQIEDLYDRYFDLAVRAASTGLFDTMAHLDLVKKFGHRPPHEVDLAPLYAEVASALGRAGVCVEVSSAGLRKPVGEIYPHPDLLRACRVAGVPATMGSDAHEPEHVGFAFPQLVTALRGAGYEQLVRFKGRERSFHPLPELNYRSVP